MLAQDFHGNGALAGNHLRIVEGVHERQLFGLLQLPGVGIGGIVGIAVQHDLTTALTNGIDLDLRCRYRHHDHRPTSQVARRQSHALRMVTGRSTDHPTLEALRRKAGNLVVGAPQLEGKHRLHVLALEPDAVVYAGRQVVSQVERGFLGQIVHLGIENFFKVIGSGRHGFDT